MCDAMSVCMCDAMPVCVMPVCVHVCMGRFSKSVFWCWTEIDLVSDGIYQKKKKKTLIAVIKSNFGERT